MGLRFGFVALGLLAAMPTSAAVITINHTLDLVPVIAPRFGLSATFQVPEFTLAEGDVLQLNIDFLGNQAFSARSIGSANIGFLRQGNGITASRMRGSIRFVDPSGTINPLLAPIIHTDPFFGTGLVVDDPAALGTDTSFARFGGVSVRFTLEDYADPAVISRSYVFGQLLIGGSDAFVDKLPALGGVPEPANWALLIAGFGLTGAAMRRRRGIPAVTV